MLGAGDDIDIIFRNIVFFLVTLHLLGAEFRLFAADAFQPLITDIDRYQIRIREVTIILRILLGTHRIGIFLIIIPASRLLNDLFSGLQQIDLSLPLPLNGSGDGLEGIQVLHLGTGSELFRSHFSHGQINIGTHRAFLKLTVGRSQILDQQT